MKLPASSKHQKRLYTTKYICMLHVSIAKCAPHLSGQSEIKMKAIKARKILANLRRINEKRFIVF